MEPDDIRPVDASQPRRSRVVVRGRAQGALGRQLATVGVYRRRRGEPEHDRLIRHLAKDSAVWAPTAGVLIGNLSHRFVENTDWDYSEFSVYDLGQAVAHMSFQAQSLGLHVRQFRAFDRAGLAAEFDVPPHWEVTTMSAIGRVPPLVQRPTSSGEPRQARQRRSPIDIASRPLRRPI